jgi:hypothetical protein
VKELRYYARFIVVCLLLERSKLAKDLAGELTHLINDYVKYMKANDTHEWQLVVQEMTLFLQADFPLHIKDATSDAPLARRRQTISLFVSLEHRVCYLTCYPALIGIVRHRRAIKAPKPESAPTPSSPAPLRLQSAILVGNRQHQVKFSELTLDMFRMMIALERDHKTIPKPEKRGSNPRKFLLYRPTISTVLQYLSSAQREQREDGVMLCYVSADPEKPTVPGAVGKSAAPYSRAGLKLKSEISRADSITSEAVSLHASKVRVVN